MPVDEIVLQGRADINRQLRRLSRQFEPQQLGRISYAVGEAVRAFMVEKYLSGQRLKRQTGKLASSFSTVNLPDRKSAAMGTRTVYAPVHELGFQGTVSVTNRQGTTFDRRMNLRERRYFRDAIRRSVKDQQRAIEVTVSRLIKDALG